MKVQSTVLMMLLTGGLVCGMLTTVNDNFLTVMLGGSPTVVDMQEVLDTFVYPGNHAGVTLTIPQCTMTHDRIYVTNFSVYSLTAAPVAPSYVVTTMNGVTLTLSMPRFRVHCTFVTPMGITVTQIGLGTASATWSGALQYTSSISVNSTSSLVASIPSFNAPIAAQLSYVYTGGKKFLFDPYVATYFTALQGKLNVELNAAAALIGLTVDPLMNGITSTINLAVSAPFCAVNVTNSQMQFVSGSTCTGSTMPNLYVSGWDVEFISYDSSTHRKGTGSMVCNVTKFSDYLPMFPPNYTPTGTAQTCVTPTEENRAIIVKSVVISP